VKDLRKDRFLFHELETSFFLHRDRACYFQVDKQCLLKDTSEIGTRPEEDILISQELGFFLAG